MTKSSPLVSVMLPCYNTERTLPMALASLQAQTYENWEALVVDDGSTDRTWSILEACSDSRVRRERFPENRGRGAARQRCLEMARGEYLTFLDSDDWLFPGKLERQVALMAEHPQFVVVSGACVITDSDGSAVGLSRVGAQADDSFTRVRFDRPAPPPLDFTASMVRMTAAREAGFNQAFRRSQDKDFLIRVLLGREYGVCGAPVYAYSQAESASLEKTLQGYRYRILVYSRHLKSYPFSSLWEIGLTAARMAVYRLAHALNSADRLIERRWLPLSPQALRAYEDAKAAVIRRLAPAGR